MIYGDRKNVPAHEAHEFFWDLFELNVVPIAIWNKEGKILNCNQAFLDMIGYSKEDFEEGIVNWKKITPPECAQYDENSMKELEDQHIAMPYAKDYIRKDGSIIQVRVHNASDHFSESGRGVTMIVPLDS